MSRGCNDRRNTVCYVCDAVCGLDGGCAIAAGLTREAQLPSPKINFHIEPSLVFQDLLIEVKHKQQFLASACNYTFVCKSVRTLYVRPSVCNTVHCGAQGRCTGLKVVPSHSYSRQLPINFFRCFCWRMYRSATKHTTNEPTKIRDVWPLPACMHCKQTYSVTSATLKRGSVLQLYALRSDLLETATLLLSLHLSRQLK